MDGWTHTALCAHLRLVQYCLNTSFTVDVKERQDRLHTMYWLPKLHKARFIASSSSCTTTAKLLKQVYLYHKLRKAFSKFYRRHNELVSKFNVGLKSLYIKAYRNQNFMVT